MVESHKIMLPEGSQTEHIVIYVYRTHCNVFISYVYCMTPLRQRMKAGQTDPWC